MDNSEKLFLTWNDFEDNQKSSFALLRNDMDLTNVTLAFEDGKQVELELQKRNKRRHPLIYTGCFFNWYPPKSSKCKKVNPS